MCSKPPCTVSVAEVSTTVGMVSKTSSRSSSETSMGVACRKVLRTLSRAANVRPFRGTASAAFEPIDHVAGVRFEQEFELGAQAGDALAQAGRLVDVFEALELGFHDA